MYLSGEEYTRGFCQPEVKTGFSEEIHTYRTVFECFGLKFYKLFFKLNHSYGKLRLLLDAISLKAQPDGG